MGVERISTLRSEVRLNTNWCSLGSAAQNKKGVSHHRRYSLSRNKLAAAHDEEASHGTRREAVKSKQ
jgi:hypothetical protein